MIPCKEPLGKSWEEGLLFNRKNQAEGEAAICIELLEGEKKEKRSTKKTTKSMTSCGAKYT